MFSISEQKDIAIEELMNLLKQTYWANERPREKVIQSLQHSVCFGAYDAEGHLIGFARVVTDYVSIYYLCDVIVDQAHRGQGIGKALVETIVDDERFVGIGALLKTRDAHGLYEKYGFQDVDCHRVMYR
uniref:GNAT family N-acetyltransferase n=1 Tax=Acetatifactor sp. TaxID=1872090 RepID=UPI00405653D6